MTAKEWIKTSEAIDQSKRAYAHFDRRVNFSTVGGYITNPEKIAVHGFYPFIHFEQKSVKYDGKGKKPKKRDICYASHIDRCIYSYYSYILNELYNQRVLKDGISSVAIAYRTNLKVSNIHSAKRAIDFIRSSSPCYVMIGDFTAFFDNLAHDYLKKQWCSLLGVERLPPDHYAIFKNITKYSTWELSDLYQLNGLEEGRRGWRKLNSQSRVLTSEQFAQNKSHIKKHENNFGIPQGSSISATLANVYMLEIDKRVNDYISSMGGLYLRYSDDFIIVLPSDRVSSGFEELRKITKMFNAIDCLQLQPDKTQYYYFDGSLISGYTQDMELCKNKNRINFLGFTFDGHKVSVRAKTISKYYQRMYKKAKTIVRNGGYTKKGNRISCKELYRLYSYKGNKKGDKRERRSGNFLSYIERSASPELFGNNELIKRDTRRHMQKIRKVLKKCRPRRENLSNNVPERPKK